MRLASTRTAVLLVLIAAALATRADGALTDGDALLQRAAAASGEPWRYHVRSILEGAQNGRLTQTQIDEEGWRVLSRRCSGVVCSGTIVDALLRRSWLFSYNGTPVAQTVPLDPQLATVRAIASYAFTSREFRREGGRVEPLPRGRLEGRTIAPFAVTAPGGATLVALLDPQTALLTAIADGRHVLYEYRKNERVGPLVLPMNVRLPDGSAETYERRDVVPEPLATPAGPAVTFDPRAPSGRLLGRTVPRFACRIGIVETRCALDTGASGLAMSLDLADRLHLNPVGRIRLRGLGALESGIVRAGDLDLGTMRVAPALYAILPDVGGFGADVVIGADVIAKAVIRLDSPHATIRFEPPDSATSGTVVPLTLDGFTPAVPITLRTLPCELAVDTGDAAAIDLSETFAKAHPGLFTPTERRAIVGIGGRATQAIGQVDVTFAGRAFRDVPIGATDVPGGSSADRIGAGFLSRFVLYLDYARARMSVQSLR